VEAFRTSPPAPPYALGPNASDAATVALSAPPADPTPEVPSAMASAAPTTGGASPHPFVSTPGGPTLFASVPAFTTVPGLLFHSPYSAAHMRACSASAPVPALSAAYTLAPSITHRCNVAPPWQCDFLASLSLLLALSLSPLWPPTPRHHAATDTIYNALQRPARATCLRDLPVNARANAHTNACTLRTAQPHHRNSRAVNRTCTRHQRCRWGPGASPRTCQHCPAQQQRRLRQGAPD